MRPRVCAVSYLNTVPLVWDPKLREIFDLQFALPSVCAERMATGESDIGILPVIEMARQGLSHFEGTGIACRGPVRSILLISKVPYSKIKTLATDAGSRTSVMLSRVILAQKYGATPKLIPMPANLAAMLGEADAALIIGDPALQLEPASLPFETLDLGEEWVNMTGLPMVFAVWSAPKSMIRPSYEQAFIDSCRYGLAHVNDIVKDQAPRLGISEELAREYLTKHIAYELDARDYQGMNLYIREALALDQVSTASGGIRG